MISPFADIAVQLHITATELARVAEMAEQDAHEIGLSPALARHIIAERQLSARLIGDAHRLIKSLIPVESAVLAIIPATGERA